MCNSSNRKSNVVVWLIGMFLLSLSGVSAAQVFPNAPVTIVNPYPPGGGADGLARFFAVQLTKEWGQPVIVENKAGAGTTIAAAYVAKAKPDGYTLLLSSTSHAIAPLLFKKLPYDYLTNLTAITPLSFSPFFLVTPVNSEFHTLDQLTQGLKRKGNKLNFGSSGSGGLPHLYGVMLNQATGGNAEHIPFSGTAPAVNAVLGGNVDFLFADTSIIPLVQSGKVRALAITSEKRAENFRQIPTLSETFPGVTSTVWTALEAPAGTPKAVINQIYLSVVKVMKMPATAKFFTENARDMKVMSPEEFGRFREAEVKSYEKLIKDAKLNLMEN
jgi:tripartite-type tricarboxylate transporter receptor subunit TctC